MNNEASGQAAEQHTMTDAEATDEAVLLLIRKLMRLQPDAYADVIKRLPRGARDAIAFSERRADVLRDAKGVRNLAYPQLDEGDGDTEQHEHVWRNRGAGTESWCDCGAAL